MLYTGLAGGFEPLSSHEACPPAGSLNPGVPGAPHPQCSGATYGRWQRTSDRPNLPSPPVSSPCDHLPLRRGHVRKHFSFLRLENGPGAHWQLISNLQATLGKTRPARLRPPGEGRRGSSPPGQFRRPAEPGSQGWLWPQRPHCRKPGPALNNPGARVRGGGEHDRGRGTARPVDAGPGQVAGSCLRGSLGPATAFNDRAPHPHSPTHAGPAARDGSNVVRSQGQEGGTFVHVPLSKGRQRVLQKSTELQTRKQCFPEGSFLPVFSGHQEASPQPQSHAKMGMKSQLPAR